VARHAFGWFRRPLSPATASTSGRSSIHRSSLAEVLAALGVELGRQPESSGGAQDFVAFLE